MFQAVISCLEAKDIFQRDIDSCGERERVLKTKVRFSDSNGKIMILESHLSLVGVLEIICVLCIGIRMDN